MRREPCDPISLERGVRQRLDDKVSGTRLGVWLLIPEYLRLGIWDLLLAWTGKLPQTVEPRIALQLVNEAALCVTGVRQQRSLSQQGFELANGLPFLAADTAVHNLLMQHAVDEALRLQAAFGKIRRASGHFQGNLFAIDPHRIRSYSRRQMRPRSGDPRKTPCKTLQTFFCCDVETHQPIAVLIGSAGITVSQVTLPLLQYAADILGPQPHRPLVLADTEHVSAKLFEQVQDQTPFRLLSPMAAHKATLDSIRTIDPQSFTPRWAGYATTTRPYSFVHSDRTFYQIVQRCGETPPDFRYKAFICTHPGDEIELLTLQYPQRWHLEEFFNTSQALGWNRAGTLNLNVRYGSMTMALLAQAALHQLRNRIGHPFCQWDASHLASELLAGLDGDIRVHDDTIVVTFYGAPNADKLAQHYQHLPAKLRAENVNPHIPWLFNYKLDFRFK